MKLTNKSSTRQKKGLDAIRLRLVLSVAIVLVFAAGVGAYLYGSSWLNDYAKDVQAKVGQADQSQDILSNLEATQVALESQSEAIKRAAEVVAESQKYKYQDQIIVDLNSYADRAGMDIRSITFNSVDEVQSSNSSSSRAEANVPAATPPGDLGRDGASLPAQPAAPKLESVSATIDLESPVNYRDFLRFMSYIEQNLTKMQIQSIGLQQSSEGGVTIQALTIEVFTR